MPWHEGNQDDSTFTSHNLHVIPFNHSWLNWFRAFRPYQGQAKGCGRMTWNEMSAALNKLTLQTWITQDKRWLKDLKAGYGKLGNLWLFVRFMWHVTRDIDHFKAKFLKICFQMWEWKYVIFQVPAFYNALWPIHLAYYEPKCFFGKPNMYIFHLAANYLKTANFWSPWPLQNHVHIL